MVGTVSNTVCHFISRPLDILLTHSCGSVFPAQDGEAALGLDHDIDRDTFLTRSLSDIVSLVSP